MLFDLYSTYKSDHLCSYSFFVYFSNFKIDVMSFSQSSRLTVAVVMIWYKMITTHYDFMQVWLHHHVTAQHTELDPFNLSSTGVITGDLQMADNIASLYITKHCWQYCDVTKHPLLICLKFMTNSTSEELVEIIFSVKRLHLLIQNSFIWQYLRPVFQFQASRHCFPIFSAG